MHFAGNPQLHEQHGVASKINAPPIGGASQMFSVFYLAFPIYGTVAVAAGADGELCPPIPIAVTTK